MCGNKAYVALTRLLIAKTRLKQVGLKASTSIFVSLARLSYHTKCLVDGPCNNYICRGPCVVVDTSYIPNNIIV